MIEGLGILLKKGKPDLIKFIRMRWAAKAVGKAQKKVNRYSGDINRYMEAHDLRKIDSSLGHLDENARKGLIKHHTLALLDLVILYSVERDLKKFGYLLKQEEQIEEDVIKRLGVKDAKVQKNAGDHMQEIFREIQREERTVRHTKGKYNKVRNEVSENLSKINKLVNGLAAESAGRTDYAQLAKDVFFLDSATLGYWKMKRGESEEFRRAKEVHRFIRELEAAEKVFKKLIDELKQGTKMVSKIKTELKTCLQDIHRKAFKSLEDVRVVAEDAFILLVTDSMFVRRILRVLHDKKRDLKRWAAAHEVPQVLADVQKQKADAILSHFLNELADERKGVLQLIGAVPAKA